MKYKSNKEEKKGLARFFYYQKLRWSHGILPSWYDFKKGLKNLVRWFKPVWAYRDWDGNYTINILIASLTFQRDRLRDYSNEIEDTLQPKIQDIEEVIDLLTKIQDESNYNSHINDHYDDLLGEDEVYFVPLEHSIEELNNIGEDSDIDENGEPKFYTMKTTREDKLGTEEYQKYRAEWSKNIRAAEAQREADRKRAFEIIANNIESWWD